MDLYILCSELVFTVSNGEMSGGRTILMLCVSVYLYGCLIRGVCVGVCVETSTFIYKISTHYWLE